VHTQIHIPYICTPMHIFHSYLHSLKKWKYQLMNYKLFLISFWIFICFNCDSVYCDDFIRSIEVPLICFDLSYSPYPPLLPFLYFLICFIIPSKYMHTVYFYHPHSPITLSFCFSLPLVFSQTVPILSC
jgi:hypothetical protein